MDEFDIETVAEPDLHAPILIEGLPGVGHVGKLAAEHLLEEFETTLLCRLYSEHFPPQVTIEDGITELACLEFHKVDLSTPTDSEESPSDQDPSHDLIVLTGDHQAQDPSGHYQLTDTILDVSEEYGVERVFTLGGVPTGELIEEYSVIGAASSEALVEELSDLIEFRENEPAGGIVGVSGLLLGLGGRRGLQAACLMGETSGYLVDPKSARAVLETLETILDFEVGYDSLEERAEEMEEVVTKIREMEQGAAPTDDDLRYIG
ncbi:proteasome assembly chaperone family protein [Halocatena salina]|uniref:Proteasome assembly chaperone family protein n=1 Tax=Halocatena salina TaxID=2934340 RepID=A0A8U0A3K0_9EURY|nr:proteasome assembly chaperone family protein [Halocatena salina]UPM43775.1 proteasome assembly chaperone family protein [Halocatena salina]